MEMINSRFNCIRLSRFFYPKIKTPSFFSKTLAILVELCCNKHSKEVINWAINYKDISNISVGYKIEVEMRSLDFEEFLWGIVLPCADRGKGYQQ
jgi:hypothetical protein